MAASNRRGRGTIHPASKPPTAPIATTCAPPRRRPSSITPARTTASAAITRRATVRPRAIETTQTISTAATKTYIDSFNAEIDQANRLGSNSNTVNPSIAGRLPKLRRTRRCRISVPIT